MGGGALGVLAMIAIYLAAVLIAFAAGLAASIPFSNTTAGYDFVASHPAFKDVVGYFAFGPLH